ncbi:peptidylprolyl isomerase [Chloroflexota bacterium]
MQQRKKRKTRRVTDRPDDLKTIASDQKSGRRKRFVIASVVLVIVLIIVGIFSYQIYIAPFQRPVLTIDNEVIRMGYFLKRASIVGGDITTTLQTLASEQVIKLRAPEFGIEVTTQDIDDALLYLATNSISGNTPRNITDTEFNEWYSQELDKTGLSNAEYRENIGTNLLTYSLKQYIAQNIPSVGEQVYLNVIVLANSADAESAKARIEAGESFADIAREVSLDTQAKENGGDYGWVPRYVLPYDSTIFGLDIGEISDPVATDPESPDTGQYLLFMVSETDPNREIDDESMQTITSNAFDGWLAQEISSHDIEINYDFNNAKNRAWIEWQLAK